MKTIADIGEFGFINFLKRRMPGTQARGLKLGIGDDAAVFVKDKNTYQLFTTDFVLEGKHFTLQKDTGFEIGWKAMARNLSDIAAMGGRPTYALVALACPKNTRLKLLDNIYRGLRKAAARFDCAIVGGDTAQFDKLAICVSLLGEVPKKELVTRSGAKPGDFIFCTGELGGSILGKHKRFIPKIEEARFLARHFKPSAMMDISDGLVQDLGHILKASRVGAILNQTNIPISHAAKSLAEKSRRSALEHALHDGEDYELLFTISPKKGSELLKRWPKSMKCHLSVIGEIKRGRAIQVKGNSTGLKRLLSAGYTHFKI